MPDVYQLNGTETEAGLVVTKDTITFCRHGRLRTLQHRTPEAGAIESQAEAVSI